MSRGSAGAAKAALDQAMVRACEADAASRALSAEWLRDGSWLWHAARQNWELCRKMSPGSPGCGEAVLRWGSMCSGSEGPAWVIAALNDLFSEKGSGFRLQHAFSCELSEEKRKWIHASSALAEPVYSSLASRLRGERESEVDWTEVGQLPEAPCIFTNIGNMGDDLAECWEHGPGCCRVESVDLLVVGTSCKDMSKANSSGVRGEAVLLSKESCGGSAQTFAGLMSYVERHRPLLILYENVDAMEEQKASGVSSLDVFMSQMASHGYEGQPVVADSSEWGLPARRRRLYVFLVRATANPLLSFADRSLACTFATFGGLLSGCMRRGPCASAVLLASSDPAVRAELRARQGRLAEQAQAHASGHGSKPAGGGHSHGAGDWVEQHMKMAELLRVRWGEGKSEDLTSSAWYQTLTDREQDALPLLRLQSPDTMMRDLSQSISRANAATWKSETGTHLAPTLLPKMNLWIEPAGRVAEPRLMLGREALMFQGFPILAFLRALRDVRASAKSDSGNKDAASDGELDSEWPPAKKSRQGLPAGQRGAGPADQRPSKPPRLLQSYRPSEQLMQDLAGNAMSLPVVLTILQCAFAALGWKSGAAVAAASTPVSKAEDSEVA